jgi:hypothetical protein
MLTLNATVQANGTGGTVTFDITDGTTTYTNQVVNYTNTSTTGGDYPYVTVCTGSEGASGEVDYIKVVANDPSLADRTGDYDVDMEDFAELAALWLTCN